MIATPVLEDCTTGVLSVGAIKINERSHASSPLIVQAPRKTIQY
jgi:hypothetical protein